MPAEHSPTTIAGDSGAVERRRRCGASTSWSRRIWRRCSAWCSSAATSRTVKPSARQRPSASVSWAKCAGEARHLLRVEHVLGRRCPATSSSSTRGRSPSTLAQRPAARRLLGRLVEQRRRVEDHRRRRRDVVEQARGAGGVVGRRAERQHQQLVERVGRALRGGIEAADRLDVVAEELEPHRARMAGRRRRRRCRRARSTARPRPPSRCARSRPPRTPPAAARARAGRPRRSAACAPRSRPAPAAACRARPAWRPRPAARRRPAAARSPRARRRPRGGGRRARAAARARGTRARARRRT